MAHVLMIEDNQDFAAFARAVLDLNGHTVAHTGSLHDGIARANQTPRPDLVLLDLDLPDGNGLDFWEQAASDMNVVAMTASTDADLARQLQALDVRYLIKPVSARDLIDVVNASLAKGEAHVRTDRTSFIGLPPRHRYCFRLIIPPGHRLLIEHV